MQCAFLPSELFIFVLQLHEVALVLGARLRLLFLVHSLKFAFQGVAGCVRAWDRDRSRLIPHECIHLLPRNLHSESLGLGLRHLLRVLAGVYLDIAKVLR